MANILDQLREFRWKGISFPVSRVRMSLSHDLAEHKYWGQDGARIEATGRAPFVVSATCHFRNNIARAKTETWSVLYPDTFRKFIVAAAEKTTGTLEHPEFGEIRCKMRSAEIDHESGRRDGCDVEATWVETREDELDAVILTDQSPVAEAELAAFDLDAALTTLTPPLSTKPEFKPDFAATMRSIAAVGDQISLLQKQAGGKISAVQYRLNQIETSALAAKNALLHPIISSCQRMRSAMTNMQQRLLQQQRDVRFYIVPRTTTLASLVVDLQGSTISDLIKLNPSLVGQPSVQAKTAVRYYTPKVAA